MKKNITKKQPTKNFRETFFEFLKTRGLKKTFKTLDYDVLIEFLLPRITETYKSVVEKFSLTAPLTLADFQMICDVENIFLTRFETAEKTLGTYFVSVGGDYQAINIKPGLKEKVKLQAAAHEISHHFLHRDAMRAGTAGRLQTMTERPPLTPEHLTAEFEADLLGALLLTHNAEVKNV